MISLIDETTFAHAMQGTVWPAYFNPVVLNDPAVGLYLKRYALLHVFPEKFTTATELDIYYNKYYWFLQFAVTYAELYGYDAGIVQQELRTIEQAEQYPRLNWSIIAEIERTVKRAA